MKNKSSNVIKNIYFFSLVLSMLSSMNICWFWSIPQTVFLFFSWLMTLFAVLTSDIFKNDRRTTFIFLTYLLIVSVNTFFGPPLNLFGYLFRILFHPPIIIGVLFLRDEYKRELFEWFVRTFTIILVISIPAWLLYLGGTPFRSSALYDVGDGYHFMYNYKFFVISDRLVDYLSPRFASVFLEPGWVGTLCCFVLFGLQFNFKRIETYPCLMGLLLSMSLSAIVNLVVCGLLWVVLDSKHKLAYVLFILALGAGISAFALNYNNGDNILNEAVMQRLVFDEDFGIAGNNRTNEMLDFYLEDMLNSSKRWLGFSDEMDDSFLETNDWYSHASGIKKSIITNGVVGVGLLIAFFTLLLIKYRCRKSFVFYMCFLMASFIRDLWQTDCYIILYISTLAVLSYSVDVEKG